MMGEKVLIFRHFFLFGEYFISAKIKLSQLREK